MMEEINKLEMEKRRQFPSSTLPHAKVFASSHENKHLNQKRIKIVAGLLLICIVQVEERCYNLSLILPDLVVVDE